MGKEGSDMRLTWLYIPPVLAILGGCAVQKDWVATGGSRSDGVVRLSYEVHELQKAELSESQGVAVAARRCKTWGYSNAEAFGGITRSCSERGGLSGCLVWMITKEYQCTGEPPQQASRAAPIPAAEPAPALGAPATSAPSAPPFAEPAAQVSPSPSANRAPTGSIGQWQNAAENFARDGGCHPQPKVTFGGKGPGYEMFSVQCTNGETYALRCEWGNCRVMR